MPPPAQPILQPGRGPACHHAKSIRSAISFAAVADADDLNSGSVPEFEKEPVHAAAEAVSGLGRLQLLDVAVVRGEVTVSAMKDVDGSLAVDAPQIGAGFF